MKKLLLLQETKGRLIGDAGRERGGWKMEDGGWTRDAGWRKRDQLTRDSQTRLISRVVRSRVTVEETFVPSSLALESRTSLEEKEKNADLMM